MWLSLLPPLILLNGLARAALDASELSSTATLYAWPLSASTPTPLATLSYSPTSLKSDILSYSPPSFPEAESEELVRIGVYDPTTGAWDGVVTSAESFDPKYQALVTLYVTPGAEEGAQALHVDFAAGLKEPLTKRKGKAKKTPKKTKAKASKAKVEVVEEESATGLKAQVVKVQQGPKPVLNRPVVLSPEGRLPEQEVEKTFLQKYWWILLGATVLLMSGGGKE